MESYAEPVGAIVSVFKTLRPCLACGREFYPPKNEKRVINDHCSDPCRRTLAHRTLHGIATAARVERPTRSDVPRGAPAPRVSPRAAAPRELRSQPDRRRHPESVTPLSRRIATLRMGRGWRQADLAAALGVHENSVAGWELGREPAISKFAALATALGVSMQQLWFGEEAS